MTFQSVDENYCKFRHPFTGVVSGSTMCGKTTYIANLIKHKSNVITPNVKRIIYCYNKWQNIFDTMPEVQFVKGWNFALDHSIPTLLIIDDQMNGIDARLAELLTVDCHHLNASIIFVTQNLFHQDKSYRTACLNAQYMILFRSPRSCNQMTYLARQLCTGNKVKRMVEAFQDATEKPYSHFIIDLKPDTPQCLRFRANVMPDEGLPFKSVHFAHVYDI